VSVRQIALTSRSRERTSSQMRILRTLCLAAFWCGCATNHLVIGKTYPPVNPQSVQIFTKPPAHYVVVAEINSDSSGSFKVSAQGKQNAAIERIRRDAAKLGANGIILKGLEQVGSASVKTESEAQSGATSSTYYSGFTREGDVTFVSATAIRVAGEH
jgi:hypothetical protein